MRNSNNVMQIVQSLECGGLEKMVISLAERLNKKSSCASICCLDKTGELAQEAEYKNIKVIAVRKKPGIDLPLVIKLAGIFRREKINVVHTHNLGPLFYGTLAARLSRVPVVINTRHGREAKVSLKLLWAMNDNIVAISHDARRRLLKFNRINEERIKVIYNGIDIKKFSEINSAQNKKIFNFDSSALVIGTIARLAPEKDQFTLIDAFSEVSQKLDNTRLIIVGDGTLRKELESYCRKRNLANKILFLGFRQDIPKILSIFDVFVLSSITEGISLTLLEAMAASRPIVATNVGGNPEIIDNGVTGFLVPPKSPDRMAEAIIKILSDKELAGKMKLAGYKRVKEKFSLDRMTEAYNNLYNYWLHKKDRL